MPEVTACQYIKVHLLYISKIYLLLTFFPHFSKNPLWYWRIQFWSNNFGTSIYQVCKRPGNRRRRGHWRWKTVISEINLKFSKKATKFFKKTFMSLGTHWFVHLANLEYRLCTCFDSVPVLRNNSKYSKFDLSKSMSYQGH